MSQDKDDADTPSLEDQINSIGFGRFQWLMTFIFGLLVVADGMELVVISVLYMALKQEWGLTEVEEGYLAGVVFVGVLLGNLVGGYLGDSWGRRKTLLASGLFFIASAAASALSPNVWVLALFRALVGFAIGAKIPVAMAITIELCPAEYRGRLGMTLVGIAFSVGEILVCAIGLAITSVDGANNWWRWMLLSCALPDVIGVPLAWLYVPESPHFLLSQGRHAELEELIKDVARSNETEGRLLKGGKTKQLTESPEEGWSIQRLFSVQLRWTTLYLTAIWCICAATYHGHIFIYPLILQHRYQMSLHDELWAVLLSGASEIPGVVLGMYLIDINGIGRRLSTVFFFGASAVTAIIVTYLASPTAFITGNMIFKALINAPFCILYVIAAEMFPTTHRSSGIAFCSACSRVAGSLMPVILSWCLALSTDLPYQVFAAILCAGAILTATNNYETLHLTLPTFSFEAGKATNDEERLPLKKAVR